MSDPQTLGIYAERAAEYDALTKDDLAQNSSLSEFIAAIPSPGRVLDLGCGPGACAAAMAQAGLVVDAIDPVPEMVALAQRHNGVSARVASFDDVSQVGTYDGIWANFSLLHAPRAELPGHLARIRIALKPGGRFHIAVKIGSGSSRDGLGRLYTYYSDAELSAVLAAADLKVISRRTGRDVGLSGEAAPWIALAAHA